jgi:hypothetical protein
MEFIPSEVLSFPSRVEIDVVMRSSAQFLELPGVVSGGDVCFMHSSFR